VRAALEVNRHGVARWPLVVGFALLSVATLFPVYFMIVNAFRTEVQYAGSKFGFPTSFNFANFRLVWHEANIGEYFRNSVVVSSGTVALSVVVAALGAYAFSKLQWRGRSLAYYGVLSVLAVPILLIMVPVYTQMVHLHLFNSYQSAILLYSAFNAPFNAYLLTSYFRSLPDELLEAARIDGASVHQIFRSIMLPLGRPALATLCIFNFLWAWNEFLYALLLLQSDSVRTLTVGLTTLQGRYSTDYPVLMAGLTISALPVIGIYLVFQRYLVRGIAVGALK
jgi:ABC-type glycerol-3-phosphate transport system permease component